MDTRKILSISILLLSLVLGACKPGSASKQEDTETPPASLVDTGWVLAGLQDQALLADPQVTLNFQADRINGSDGCNQYSGSYTQEGEALTFADDRVTTLMACEQAVMDQASAYLAALKQTASYQVAAGELRLLDADGKTLATFQQQRRELTGTSWIVTGYNNGQQAVVSVLAGSTVTAGFRDDGRIVGSGGCNNYSATYEVAAEGIKIGPAVSTKMACNEPAGVMDQEMQFLAALSSATAYQINGDVLELRSADGALAVSLLRAP